MKKFKLKPIPTVLFCLLVGSYGTASAGVEIQCPNDFDKNATIDINDTLAGPLANFPNNVGDIDQNGDGVFQTAANTKCKHLSGSDGYVTMGDGYTQYMFGFGDLTGTLEANSLEKAFYNARLPSSQIVVEQGQDFYLTLTNPGMLTRPDLFDAHTIHYHGFPNISGTYDGVPELSIAVNQNASLTYFYRQTEPGTYMYHCHVEATEHMEMGMLGNLYVHAAQDNTVVGTVLSNPATPLDTHTHAAGDRYAYNDSNGNTLYNVEVPLQIHAFDSEFHDASRFVQPLPFAALKDRYVMFNGRGYPDTTNTAALPAPSDDGGATFLNAIYDVNGVKTRNEVQSQTDSSLVTATVGQKILLRLSNLSVSQAYTVGMMGLDFKVVGRGAKILRSKGEPTGTQDLSYKTNTVNIAPGEGYDLIIDTAGLTPGSEYYVYSANLNYLSNNNEDFGGLMTKIVIN